jgi:hypothetical protein
LSRGRSLLIRPVTAEDLDGLVQLYDALSDEDRYRRFFSLYRPERAFFEAMASVAERGGFGVVAILSGDLAHPDGRLVGEAGYTLGSDGDGELEIAVAEDWRGWLGPYLLAVLVDAAARRGVPNLRADILTTNRAMLALLRARGYATIDRDDWSTMRVVIGTAGDMPRWPAHDERPRVLVEVPGGRWSGAAAARAAGLHVLACPGPDTNARCPALAGRRCPLAADADVIVVAPPAEDAQWQALLESHAEVHPGIPVCVQLPSSSSGGETAVIELVQRLARGAPKR